MGRKPVGVDRRDFLKAGGAGLAGLVSAPRWAGSLTSSNPPQRGAPLNPVILRSAHVEVILDRKDALPYEYRLAALNTCMRGEDSGRKIAVILCRRNPWGFVTTRVQASSVRASETQADFQFNCAYEVRLAVEMVVRYVLDGATLYVTLENVKEQEGYELIEVGMPRLATVREEDGPSWVAQANDGGSVVALDEARPGELPVNTFWGKVLVLLR